MLCQCEASSYGILVNIQNGSRKLLFGDQLVFVRWVFLQFASVQAQICASVGENLTRRMNGIKLPHDGQQQLWRSAECQNGLDISQKL